MNKILTGSLAKTTTSCFHKDARTDHLSLRPIEMETSSEQSGCNQLKTRPFNLFVVLNSKKMLLNADVCKPPNLNMAE